MPIAVRSFTCALRLLHGGDGAEGLGAGRIVLRHDPQAGLQKTVLEGVGDAVIGLGSEDVGAGVPQQAHDAFAVPHQALAFGAAVPVEHILLDGSELGEGALDVERIELVERDTVGDQAQLEHGLGILADHAAAGIFLQVEEVCEGRRLLDLGRVPGEHGGEHVVHDAVLVGELRGDLALVDDAVVDLLQGVARPELGQRRDAAIADVPGDVARLDHCQDLAVEGAAAVQHHAAALRGEGLHIGFVESLHGGAAVIDHDDLLARLCAGSAGGEHCGSGEKAGASLEEGAPGRGEN
ncbi:hypothetical protein ACVI53_005218 [Bradyrhizobium barranii subsp. barranii]